MRWPFFSPAVAESASGSDAAVADSASGSDAAVPNSASRYGGATVWTSDRAAPFRAFLRTEAGSAGVLVAAVVAALVWANIDVGSYDRVWQTRLSIAIGDTGIDRDLQTWVNSGLMTLFFLVVGLEARREFDLGELRERRRFVLPLLAGIAGMLLPVALFLAVNAGKPSAHGWGVAMSTDTALALGLLALLGRTVPDRARLFVLTLFVVDDLIALLIIALVYSEHITLMPLLIAVAVLALLPFVQRLPVADLLAYGVLGIVSWVALLESGVDPVVAGLVVGLSASAYTPSRGDLEQATGLVREFREQPTAQLARSATAGLTSALSPNARLQNRYHAWTSYLIVPLFALANAGIVINGSFLSHAYTAPVTVGVLLGYLVGKPLAIMLTSWLVTRVSGGRIVAPVGWASVVGSGTIAGIGFTVALLIATRAFAGDELKEAKLGALTAAAAAALITGVVFRLTALLPEDRRAAALLGRSDQLVDLADAVDERRDHHRGPAQASVTIVEYGDFECPYCGQAEQVVRELLSDSDLRYVWRHLPLTDVHPEAQLAAEAAEAADAQGAFWPMYELLFSRQNNLRPSDLLGYADTLGLDLDKFRADLKRHVYAARVAQDVESADLSGVSGTPTFFINGQRHYGSYDIETLSRAVRTARGRVLSAGVRRRRDVDSAAP